ncbi:hypothetical protein DAKH74_011270 [Maudiozyma humilis]|uniref:Uncharacterized protein n=1 Tax=Maudiozyma humilis TaxID=51915 RepID=A0AAV5RSM1_MAUHU|nr:hypothetical protein DAKH74_011270 [Kazachstania humilis]
MLANYRGFQAVVGLTLIVACTLISSVFISYDGVFSSSRGKLLASANAREHAPAHITLENYREFVKPLDRANSTTLFNAIYAALRQAGSDIHPIGVSYFPAVIPKGTLLYHTGRANIPEGLEWLAMDHEFSYSFAMHSVRYGRNATQGWMHGPPGGNKSLKNISGDNPPMPPHDRASRAHFLTFRATRDLTKLLYLDGASAAKTESGEMDTQKLLSDVIAKRLNESDGRDDSDPRKRFVMEERVYAERICKWGKPFGLDGYVRVEVGFEVVLCDFLNGSTELVSNITLPQTNKVLGLPDPANVTVANGWPLDDEGLIIEDEMTPEQVAIMDQEDEWQRVLDQYSSMLGFDQIRAGYVHDKGDRRIALDYRYLVTGVNRTLGDADPNGRRLLNDNLSDEDKEHIVDDLEYALQRGFDSGMSTDWQQVVDEIVDKFAPMVKVMSQILSSSEVDSRTIALKVTRYTLNFVLRFSGLDNTVLLDDDTSGDFGFGRHFAVYEYTRPLKDLHTDADYLIWSALVNVVTDLVDTVYDIHELLMPVASSGLAPGSPEPSPADDAAKVAEASTKISALIDQLHWIALDYQCDRKCAWDEVCYTPSWGPSPLSWADPGSNRTTFGMHYNPAVDRMVINTELQCISADFLIAGRH